MKKYFVFIGLFFLIGGISAQAQFKFGLKAGVNLANASFKAESLDPKNFIGFQAGPMMEYIVPAVGLGFDAAVLYSQQGFKIDKEVVKLSALEVPVNLKYKLTFAKVIGIYGAVGPYIDFKLSDLKGDWENESFGAGLNFGLGIELLSHLQVGANYKLGLTDDFSAKEGLFVFKGKPTIWSITAAFLF